jgi:homoserine dehydrogenase
MQSVGVGILGFGTIGAGTAGLLLENAETIAHRLGFPLRLVRIADLDITTRRPVSLPPGTLTTKAEEVINGEDIDVVVELIGGIEPAKTFILRALAAGKSVVTANKALLAEHGAELLAAATAAGRDLAFEASVGGGIPVLRSLREGLCGDRINAIYGIINGTSNFILTAMTKRQAQYADVLAEAQRLGYAEADPTLDVGGFDSAHKIAILASIGFNRIVPFDQVHVTGITGILPMDLEAAAEFGYIVKLLGIAKETASGLQLRVHPTMIPADSLLAEVDGVANAVVIRGDWVGSVMMTGPGAGARPTATAVVGDLIDLARNLRLGRPGRVPPLMTASPVPATFAPMSDLQSAFYFRLLVEDKPGVLSQIAGVFGRHGISLESVIQQGRSQASGVPIVLMTHKARERDIQASVDELNRLDVTCEPVHFIRVEDEL